MIYKYNYRLYKAGDTLRGEDGSVILAVIDTSRHSVFITGQIVEPGSHYVDEIGTIGRFPLAYFTPYYTVEEMHIALDKLEKKIKQKSWHEKSS